MPNLRQSTPAVSASLFPCPQCGEAARIKLIEPHPAAPQENRTFECSECGLPRTYTVELIKHAPRSTPDAFNGERHGDQTVTGKRSQDLSANSLDAVRTIGETLRNRSLTAHPLPARVVELLSKIENRKYNSASMSEKTTIASERGPRIATHKWQMSRAWLFLF